jgi:hypothetical protein
LIVLYAYVMVGCSADECAGDSFEPYRWRAKQRQEYLKDMTRRKNVAAREFYRRCRDRREAAGEESGAEGEQHTRKARSFRNGSPKEKKRVAKPSADRPRTPPSREQVPNMSPMPQAVVEEPPSDAGFVRGNTFGAASPPESFSVVSPVFGTRSLSRSPLSAVSGLREG